MLHLRIPNAASDRKARFDHLPPQATASILRQDSQVMQITPPPIVAAEHGTDQPRAISGDQAEAWIPIQEGPKLLWGVGFVQSHPFRLAPQIEHGFEIAGCHGRKHNVHGFRVPARLPWRR